MMGRRRWIMMGRRRRIMMGRRRERRQTLPGAVPEGGEAVDVDVDDLRPNPETFVHVAVGCDACGVYPIKGRRF